MDMDISMDIHAKSVDMDMDMDGKFHIHGNPENFTLAIVSHSQCISYVTIINTLYKKHTLYLKRRNYLVFK